jgi:hypothetical protein
MKNTYTKRLAVLILCLLVIPQFALASWWNPFTWKIFRRNAPAPVVVVDTPVTTPPIDQAQQIEELKKEVEALKTKSIESPINTAPAKKTTKIPAYKEPVVSTEEDFSSLIIAAHTSEINSINQILTVIASAKKEMQDGTQVWDELKSNEMGILQLGSDDEFNTSTRLINGYNTFKEAITTKITLFNAVEAALIKLRTFSQSQVVAQQNKKGTREEYIALLTDIGQANNTISEWTKSITTTYNSFLTKQTESLSLARSIMDIRLKNLQAQSSAYNSAHNSYSTWQGYNQSFLNTQPIVCNSTNSGALTTTVCY